MLCTCYKYYVYIINSECAISMTYKVTYEQNSLFTIRVK